MADSYNPEGHYQGSLSTVVSLASLIGTALPSGASHAVIQAETGDIRWRDDGTNPTTAVGQRLYQGTSMWYIGDLAKLRLVAVSGTVTVNVAFYE